MPDEKERQEFAEANEAKWERPSANSHQVGGTHYQGEYTQQHWDYTWERGFDQFQYAITKYVERWKRKDGVEGLLKARHYLDKYIELVEAAARAGKALPGVSQR